MGKKTHCGLTNERCVMDMRKEWDRTNAARIAEIASVTPMERANAHDRTQWNRFTGKTKLHRHINAYLCRQFLVTTNESVHINACELEATTIIEMVEGESANSAVMGAAIVAVVSACTFAVGIWVGCQL